MNYLIYGKSYYSIIQYNSGTYSITKVSESIEECFNLLERCVVYEYITDLDSEAFYEWLKKQCKVLACFEENTYEEFCLKYPEFII